MNTQPPPPGRQAPAGPTGWAAALGGVGVGVVIGAVTVLSLVGAAGFTLAATGHLDGLRSTFLHASAPAPAGPAPTEVDTLTACALSAQGRPDVPSALLVDCPTSQAATVQLNLPGPFTPGSGADSDGSQQHLDGTYPAWMGWDITTALVVDGEARVWFTQDDLRCLLKRDLLDTRQQTAVICQLPPSPAPTPDPTSTPVPAPQV